MSKVLPLLLIAATAAQNNKTFTNGTTDCLCIFDIDRTLTGRQGFEAQCPAGTVIKDVQDCAYSGGTLMLSELSTHLSKTFCGGCWIGVVSAGSACGAHSPERGVLVDKLNATGRLPTGDWAPAGTATTPLVTNWPDGEKQKAVGAIVDWYGQHGHSVSAPNVHFFDDKKSNVAPFSQTKYNARQISCSSRDPNSPDIGLCGAAVSEIVATAGVHLC